MRPHLSVLCYGGVHPGVIDCIDREFNRSPFNWSRSFERPDAAVNRARARSAAHFLYTGQDVLVQLDHDIIFQQGNLDYLALEAFQRSCIVGALVSKKNTAQGFGGRLPKGRWELGTKAMVELPEHCYVGGAMTAYSREVFVALSAHTPPTVHGYHPFFHPIHVLNPALHEVLPEELQEDWAIQRYYRDIYKLGKVYATMWPVTGHVGQMIFTAIDANPNSQGGAV